MVFSSNRQFRFRTELLRLHERHLRAGRRCLLVKFAGDTRYDKDCVATHDRFVSIIFVCNRENREKVLNHVSLAVFRVKTNKQRL